MSHPCIAAVHDVGETADGRIYIALELVVGRSLRDWLDDEALDVPTALHVAKEVSRALVKAHGLGIVHRDLKPDNVMLSDEHAVKVLDFGLAKPLSTRAETPAAPPVTRDDRVLGTPGYMSPEQAAGREIDARTDLFSVGVVLYEMLTGERPFKGGSAIDVIVSTARDEPPRPVGIGNDVVRVILRCLEKNPDARYADANELLRALEAVDATAETVEKRAPRESGGEQPTQVSLVTTAVVAEPKGRARQRFVAAMIGVSGLISTALGVFASGSKKGTATSRLEDWRG
ncbi:MAG TPA: serine/threonine-protein kinase, partial [Gemmatimonadaceae bacterium]|nr:serine/threonine-protein kinase [Gemmatimonadaceae bacterium]